MLQWLSMKAEMSLFLQGQVRVVCCLNTDDHQDHSGQLQALDLTVQGWNPDGLPHVGWWKDTHSSSLLQESSSSWAGETWDTEVKKNNVEMETEQRSVTACKEKNVSRWSGRLMWCDPDLDSARWLKRAGVISLCEEGPYFQIWLSLGTSRLSWGSFLVLEKKAWGTG